MRGCFAAASRSTSLDWSTQVRFSGAWPVTSTIWRTCPASAMSVSCWMSSGVIAELVDREITTIRRSCPDFCSSRSSWIPASMVRETFASMAIPGSFSCRAWAEARVTESPIIVTSCPPGAGWYAPSFSSFAPSEADADGDADADGEAEALGEG